MCKKERKRETEREILFLCFEIIGSESHYFDSFDKS